MRIHLRDPGWLLTLAVGASALLVTVTLITTRLVTPSELAVIPTEAWPWTSDGVRVEPDAAGSPFQPGDLVTALDGRSVGAWVEGAMPLVGGGAIPRLGSVVTFEVVRDGRAVTFPVTLMPFPTERLGSAPIGLVAYGAGALALALVLVRRRSRSTPLRLLFVAAVANVADITAWEVDLQPTDFGTGSPYLLAFASAPLFNFVFWSAIVHLLTIYPVRSPLAVRHGAIIPLLYGAPVVGFLAIVAIARLAGGTTLDWVDRLASAVAIVASVMLVAVILSTFAAYRRASPAVRRSVRLIAITLVIAAAATLGLMTLPIAVLGAPLVPRTTVSLVALSVPIALVAAVVRDRLFQVGLISRSRERIVAAREDERRKLRRDLHDGLAPGLAAAGLKLDVARQSVRSDPETAERLIGEAGHDVRDAIADIRRLSRDLRPPALDALGLVGAIREQATRLGEPSGPGQVGGGPVIIVDAPDDLPALPAAVEVAAYRIAVEGMMNVVRHASAATCRVRVGLIADELQVDVIDDGTGTPDDPGGVGMRSMRERAAEVGGDLTIERAVPRGTRLGARLPIDLAELGRAPA